MASAASARRKLASLKASVRKIRRPARSAAKPKTTPPPTEPPRTPREPSRTSVPAPVFDYRRTFVSPSPEERLRRLPRLSAQEPRRAAPPPTASTESGFSRAQADSRNLPPPVSHWIWAGAAYLLFILLATASVAALPDDATASDSWRAFTLWCLFVLAAASMLVLSWRNVSLPTVLLGFVVFILAWRSPFLSVGVFADAAEQNWTVGAVPWWSLLAITFTMKALETRGRRRRYQLRMLMVLQGMQIATYAGLVLLSIFFLGRSGTIEAAWGVTLVSLLVAWFIQGRSLLSMWNRDTTIESAPKALPAPVWAPSELHTGK